MGRDLVPAGPAVRVDLGAEAAPEGVLLARRGYDADGGLLWRHEIAHNAEGRETSVTAYDAAGTRIGHVDLRYDSEDRELTGAGWDSSTGGLLRYEREYYGSGLDLLRETSYDPDGGVSWTARFQYEYVSYYDGAEGWHSRSVYALDAAGRTIREDEYETRDGREELARYYVPRYDADGRMTRRDVHDPDGTRTGYSTYAYDADGQETLEVQYDVTYDAGGTAVETRAWSYARTYDERGWMIRGESRDGDEKLIYRWEDEFDSEGRQTRYASYEGVWRESGGYTDEIYLSHETLYADGWRTIRDNEYRYDRDKGTSVLSSYVLYEYG